MDMQNNAEETQYNLNKSFIDNDMKTTTITVNNNEIDALNKSVHEKIKSEEALNAKLNQTIYENSTLSLENRNLIINNNNLLTEAHKK